jgi:transcriptional regulator with XRE-family HTH domain
VSNSSQPESPIIQAIHRQRQRRRGGAAEAASGGDGNFNAEVEVGRHLRKLRTERGLSIRSLAEFSGLNVNTLSLIENGRTSPSVSTLQHLARALDTPIIAFFEVEPVSCPVVYTPCDERPLDVFGGTGMHNLGHNLNNAAVQAFEVALVPGAGSGDRMIVHTGHELVYCLQGTVRYRIDGTDYLLRYHDSLVFEAHLPHCWENAGTGEARFLLALFPADARDEPGSRHFPGKMAV